MAPKKRKAKCLEKHTRYQPTISEWNCPKCGAKAGHWAIEDSSNYECNDLHLDDTLLCGKCGYGTTGRAFAKKCVDAKNLVPCKHCGGKGLVKALASRAQVAEARKLLRAEVDNPTSVKITKSTRRVYV